ncbi:hypothetical protein MTBLM5_80119 [Magnetospirillum sp. LM-5]|nr:hypothetical protein MTBLM5_80119 [Magnetospirillum sp. LM-5]
MREARPCRVMREALPVPGRLRHVWREALPVPGRLRRRRA